MAAAVAVVVVAAVAAVAAEVVLLQSAREWCQIFKQLQDFQPE